MQTQQGCWHEPIARSPSSVNQSSRVRLPTSGAALVDDNAQSVAHRESQIRTLVDGHAEDAGDAFEGRQQVHGTCAEAGEHGPNLKAEHRHARLSH